MPFDASKYLAKVGWFGRCQSSWPNRADWALFGAAARDVVHERITRLRAVLQSGRMGALLTGRLRVLGAAVAFFLLEEPVRPSSQRMVGQIPRLGFRPTYLGEGAECWGRALPATIGDWVYIRSGAGDMVGDPKTPEWSVILQGPDGGSLTVDDLPMATAVIFAEVILPQMGGRIAIGDDKRAIAYPTLTDLLGHLSATQASRSGEDG